MKHLKKLSAGLAGLLTLVSCSRADVLNATIPREGYQLVRDVAYGPNARQKMDLYIPEGLTAKAPVVLFFYGGSWQTGSKDYYRFLGQALASKGIVTAVADYRLYPEVYFPDFVKDGARAFAYLHAHAGDYQGDPAQLYLAGHSAGAFIAMMLTVNDRYLAEAGAKKSWIHGTIGIAGPYDFLPLTDDTLKKIFSKQDLALTQPIHFIHTPQPRMFLAHGLDDDTVGLKNTQHVTERLQMLHSPVETHYYPDVGHIGIILSLAQGFRDKDPLLKEVSCFIHTPCGD